MATEVQDIMEPTHHHHHRPILPQIILIIIHRPRVIPLMETVPLPQEGIGGKGEEPIMEEEEERGISEDRVMDR